MNLLLLVYDCLRLDYFREHMPTTARAIARPGWTTFDNHWSMAHCSDPNFSTLLSGDPPWISDITTQMGAGYKKISPYLLPTLLKKKGFDTWAVQPVLVPKFYHQFEKIAWHKTDESADLELRAIKQFVSESDGQPWFGFVRDMTAHYPYMGLDMPPRGEAAQIQPQYEQAVAHIDSHASAVIKCIQKNSPNTAIILCADHGELLGEHGKYDHLHTLYNYLVRVPMAVYVPGVKQKRTSAMTQHIDVWQTALDLLDIECNKERWGKSWKSYLVDNEKLPPFRTLKMQGIGAGAISSRHLEEKGDMAIDPELGRVLWRHRAMVNGRMKLIENIHADGKTEVIISYADDYAEEIDTKTNRSTIKRLSRGLPPVPEYHAWERETIEKRSELIILDRLKALGYA